MSDFLAGEGYLTALLWTFGALALLVILLFAVRRMRGINTGSLIPGGRGRLPRLGVVEAAAVDNQRRLVLVRRDNIEHLILIGGPSDIIIEPQIQQSQPARQAPKAAAPASQPSQRRETAAPRPEPVAPAQPAQRAAGQAPAAPAAAENKPERREPNRTSQPQQRQAPVAPSPATGHKQTPSQAQKQTGTGQEPSAHESEEEALLRHVDVSIDEIKSVASNERTEPSVEDEMSRLLDDISDRKDRG